MTIDWPTVATTVLGSGVVAAAVTQGIIALRDHTKHKADGRMAALLAALALERFGSACAELVIDADNYHHSGGVVGRLHAKLPAMSPFRASIDLNLLPLYVTSILLEFEVSAEQANIDLQYEFAEDRFALSMPIFLRLGEAGFKVARKVREKMGLPHLLSHELGQSLRFLLEQSETFEHDMLKNGDL